MRITYIWVLAMVFLMSVVCTARCAETKIAVVDMGRVIKVFPEAKSADSLLEKQIGEFESQHRDMLAERSKLKKDFEAASDEARNKALSEKARDRKMEIAGDKLVALRECERNIREISGLRQKQIADQKIRMRRRIVSKLREIIGQYARKNGYFLVLDSSGLGMNGVETVVYNLERIDITDNVLKVIEKK